jgi:hypothetical protein
MNEKKIALRFEQSTKVALMVSAETSHKQRDRKDYSDVNECGMWMLRSRDTFKFWRG